MSKLAIAAIMLVFACCAALANAEAEKSAVGQPAASVKEKSHFAADRFGAAYDRVARRSDTQAAGSATAGSPQPNVSLLPFISKMILSLLVVVGIIYAIGYGMRRLGAAPMMATPGPLKVLSRQQISQKSSIYIVAAMDRYLIIGESTQGLNCLAEFSDSGENQKIRETWGWDGIGVKQKNRLFSPKESPFGANLQSHVDELKRDLNRFQEVS